MPPKYPPLFHLPQIHVQEIMHTSSWVSFLLWVNHPGCGAECAQVVPEGMLGIEVPSRITHTLAPLNSSLAPLCSLKSAATIPTLLRFGSPSTLSRGPLASLGEVNGRTRFMNAVLPENGLLPLIGSAPVIPMAAVWLYGENMYFINRSFLGDPLRCSARSCLSAGAI